MKFNLHDVVATTCDISDTIEKGFIGTIVHEYANNVDEDTHFYEVEFKVGVAGLNVLETVSKNQIELFGAKQC